MKQELFSYWLQLLTSLIQANFLLVAWYSSMLLYWSRSAKPTGSKFSFSLNGRDSSDLLYPSLFLPFTWTSYSESNSLSPFYSFGQNYSKSNSFFFLLFGQKYSKSKLPLLVALLGQKKSESNSKSTKIFQDIFILCLSCKSLPILQKCSKSHFLSDFWKFTLFAYLLHTFATGVWTVSANASFGIGVCGLRGRTSVLKQEWIINCATLMKVLERDLIGNRPSLTSSAAVVIQASF